MPPMSTIPIHRPEFHALFFNGSPSPFKFPRMAASWTMTMDSRFSPTMNTNNNMKKKEELSVQLSTPPVPKVETFSSNNLQFDRLQPSDQELVRENKFDFGQFVAREAVLDEEYWTAAWLRAESHWENRTYERYVDNYKRKFAEQEFNAVKRRCKVQNGDSCSCIIAVRKEQKNVKHSILKSVVGTLDLNIRYFLQGETFPGERVKAPLFCNIKRTPPSRYAYIANLCVAKSARRQGIASNMIYFAVETAKSNGVTQIYVHVDRNNSPAQILYQKMGFELPRLFQMVETANSRLLLEETYLLRLQM
ncbi:GCN5-related N-acetyltransferase 6, chloroplastic-like isoform X2 [Gastrolobium bilobum]|uniref:GCN5-related N-acetyltransferase 6, chloroplastic-like isoform X2 n=1 Tax=Gastrolobium bilobum TaxID=150636 RepID=UPI002AB1EE93|nr:GCN5-related N-acetyltransferase 6, chloroplastic-like isoform X2 [Gastrolobium bilobum]